MVVYVGKGVLERGVFDEAGLLVGGELGAVGDEFEDELHRIWWGEEKGVGIAGFGVGDLDALLGGTTGGFLLAADFRDARDLAEGDPAVAEAGAYEEGVAFDFEGRAPEEDERGGDEKHHGDGRDGGFYLTREVEGRENGGGGGDRDDDDGYGGDSRTEGFRGRGGNHGGSLAEFRRAVQRVEIGWRAARAVG